jgi:hypothetical protein
VCLHGQWAGDTKHAHIMKLHAVAALPSSVCCAEGLCVLCVTNKLCDVCLSASCAPGVDAEGAVNPAHQLGRVLVGLLHAGTQHSTAQHSMA